MSEWTWVLDDVVLALHERQLSEHGGPAGLRNPDGLSSAMARAPNLAAYGDPDASALAAAYANGIARNHPFVDGNKRTAWVVARLFLKDNQVRMSFEKADAIAAMLALAAGELSEEQLANWFRERISEA